MYRLGIDLLHDKLVNPDIFKIKELCLKAISLNSNLPKAHAILGDYILTIEQDYEGFRKEQLKALELNPNFALAHYYLSNWNVNNSMEYKDRLYHIEQAILLDPNSLFTKRYYDRIINIYFELHAFDQAKIYAQKLIELDKNDIAWLTLTYMRLGEYLKAEELIKSVHQPYTNEYLIMAEIYTNHYQEYRKALDLLNDYYRRNQNIGHKDHRYGLTLWLSGDSLNGAKFLKNALLEFSSKASFMGGFDNCYDTAGIYAILGETEKALDLLENNSCFLGNGLDYYAPHDSFFKELKNNPRFKRIIQRRIDEKTKIREAILIE